MDFLLISTGSHGDVHPFLGLGQALRQRGHRVRLCVNEHFEAMVHSCGLEFVAMGTDELFKKTARDARIWHPFKGTFAMLRYLGYQLPLVYDAVEKHAGTDTVVVVSTWSFGARSAAEKLGLRCATAHVSPAWLRSKSVPPTLPGGFNTGWVPRPLRPFFWKFADRIAFDKMTRAPLNRLRAKHGLPPVQRVMDGYFHSPQLTIGMWPQWFFPKLPADPSYVHSTAFPNYDQSDQTPLDPKLEAWLSAGPAPVAFTFGSAMVYGARFFKEAVEACRILKCRGLMLAQTRDQLPADLGENILYVQYAPYSQLLPRCSAIVHHGGIGTISLAIRSNTPQVCMPMAHDQFDNVAIARRLGVAEVISMRRFKAKRVASKIKRVLSSAKLKAALAEASRRANADAPFDAACDLLEQLGAAPFKPEQHEAPPAPASAA